MNKFDYAGVTAKQSLGIPLNEIENRQHNLWFGISFGNKAFTNENIKKLLLFALHFTKDKVLIEISGRNQAINYRYFDGLSRAEALQAGFAEEERRQSGVKKIVASFPQEDREKISIAHYDDLFIPRFVKNREEIFREFSKQSYLYREILDVVEEVMQARKRTITKNRLEAIAIYIIQELPMFLAPIQTLFSGTEYEVILYPGMGKLDELVMNIKQAPEYNDLRSRLNLPRPSGIVDVIFEK